MDRRGPYPTSFGHVPTSIPPVTGAMLTLQCLHQSRAQVPCKMASLHTCVSAGMNLRTDHTQERPRHLHTRGGRSSLAHRWTCCRGVGQPGRVVVAASCLSQCRLPVLPVTALPRPTQQAVGILPPGSASAVLLASPGELLGSGAVNPPLERTVT